MHFPGLEDLRIDVRKGESMTPPFRLHIPQIIVVEGRYDQAALAAVTDATILTTRGFGIFRDAALRALLRRLAAERGVILLTDSDGAGLRIRTYLQSFLPSGSMTNLYIPPVSGKERRKAAPSAENLLGVEGMSHDLLRSLLAPFAATERSLRTPVTKAMLYELGLSGGAGSAAKRRSLCRILRLPQTLSANKLCEVLTLLYGAEELEGLLVSGTVEEASGA